MGNKIPETRGPLPLEEFIDKAIDDPARLNALQKRLRRPRPRSAWRKRLLLVAVIAVAVFVGFLISRVIP